MAAIGLVILAAGCGASPRTSTGIASSRYPAKFRHQIELALKYSACMRTHGVPHYADPKISASSTELNMQNPQISPSEIASPAYQRATGACARYLPQQQAPTSTNTVNSDHQALRFAACMRAHGVPDFPDPNANGAFKLGSAINSRAPAFMTAITDCRKVRASTLQLGS